MIDRRGGVEVSVFMNIFPFGHRHSISDEVLCRSGLADGLDIVILCTLLAAVNDDAYMRLNETVLP